MRGLLSFICWAIVIFIVMFEAWTRLGILGVLLASLVFIGILIYSCRVSLIFALGTGKFNSGDKTAAFKMYEKAYATGKLKSVNALYYAYLLLRDGQLEKSESLLNEISKKYEKTLSYNDNLNISLNKALIKWKQGDLKSAISEAEELYEKGIKMTSLYGVLGYWYILDSRLDDALKINKEALEYNDSDQIIWDNLAQNYFLLGDIEKSEEMYKELLEKNPKFIEPYYNYGIVLKSKGDLNGAKDYFEKALLQEEKFLSTVTHNKVRAQLDALN